MYMFPFNSELEPPGIWDTNTLSPGTKVWVSTHTVTIAGFVAEINWIEYVDVGSNFEYGECGMASVLILRASASSAAFRMVKCSELTDTILLSVTLNPNAVFILRTSEGVGVPEISSICLMTVVPA